MDTWSVLLVDRTVRSSAGRDVGWLAHYLATITETPGNITARDSARVTVVPHIGQSLWVRVPAWSPEESVSIVVGDRRVEALRLGYFAYIADVRPGEPVALEYALPVESDTELIDGVDYEVSWQGDDVTGISPNTDFLPFYPTAS